MTDGRNLIDDERQSFVQDRKKRSARLVVPTGFAEFNSLGVSKTTVTTTATKITTPDAAVDFFIICKDGDFYIGDEDVTTSTGFPLDRYDSLPLTGYQKSDNNEIYGITTTGTVTVYTVGSTKL